MALALVLAQMSMKTLTLAMAKKGYTIVVATQKLKVDLKSMGKMVGSGFGILPGVSR